jgi:hypothetical protein
MPIAASALIYAELALARAARAIRAKVVFVCVKPFVGYRSAYLLRTDPGLGKRNPKVGDGVMARRLNFGRPRGAAVGAIIGAVLGVVAPFALDPLVSAQQSLWWPPVAAVICGIGGAVVGMLLAVEIEGEIDESFPPPETSSGVDRRSAPDESPRR